MFSSCMAMAILPSRLSDPLFRRGVPTLLILLFVVSVLGPSSGCWDLAIPTHPPVTSAISPRAPYSDKAVSTASRGTHVARAPLAVDVTNVSITPYTYTEEFVGDHAVLSRDNLKISFAVHTVWRVDDEMPLFMERFSTTVTNGDTEKSPDAIVKVAYVHSFASRCAPMPATRSSAGTA